MMMIIKILPKHLLPVHHQNGCSHSRRSITSKIICIFVSFLKFYRIFFLFFFSLKWNFSFYISITQCVLLIDVVQYRRYSSCVSFQCTSTYTEINYSIDPPQSLQSIAKRISEIRIISSFLFSSSFIFFFSFFFFFLNFFSILFPQSSKARMGKKGARKKREKLIETERLISRLFIYFFHSNSFPRI